MFSPFVDWYILLPVFLKGKDPVLYVGNEILDDYGAFAQTEEKRAKLEECNESGSRWMVQREMTKMGDFELHPHALNGMVVYWRKKSEDVKVPTNNKTAEVGKDEGTGQEAEAEAETVTKRDSQGAHKTTVSDVREDS